MTEAWPPGDTVIVSDTMWPGVKYPINLFTQTRTSHSQKQTRCWQPVASSHSHPSWLYSDVELELKYLLLPIRGGVKAEGRKDVWPDRAEADPVSGSLALIGQPLDGELQFVLNITCSHAHSRLMIAGHERIIKK